MKRTTTTDATVNATTTMNTTKKGAKNMTKNAMLKALTNVGITIYGDSKMKKEDVARYYDSRFNKKEEKNMTTATENTNVTINAPGQNKEEEKKAMEAKKQAEKEAKAQAKKAEQEKKAAEKAKKAEERKAAKEKAEADKAAEKEAKAQAFDRNQSAVLDTLGALDGITLEAYPNLPDWIKVQQANKTALEIRFGKKELRIQADEKDAELTGYTYKVVKSFSKSATFQFQYNDPAMLQTITNLLKVRAQRLADAKAAKEKAKAEEKAKKEQERAAKKEAKQKAKAEEKVEEQ